MSSCFVVQLASTHIDCEAVAATLRRREPSFAFVEPFDFAIVGRCPCRLRGVECGFEFEWQEADQTAGPSEALLIFRASDLDRICALLVAAALAELGNGALTDSDGDELEIDQAYDWALAELSTFPAPKKKRGRKGQDPAAELDSILGALAGASIDRVMTLQGADPSVSVCFSNGVTLQASRWDWRAADAGYATRSLPRELPGSQHAGLLQGRDGLLALMRSGPLHSAQLNPDLSLQLLWQHGEVRIYPEGDNYASAQERLLAGLSDPWELDDRGTSFRPDVENRRILRR